MSYINFCTVTIFLYLLMTVQPEMVRWLMLGDTFTKDEVPEIGLLSEESLYIVSTSQNVEIETKEKRIITSVIAASMFMHGYVTVINGGINHTKVEVLYTSEYLYPDMLYIYLQSAWQFPSRVMKNGVKINGAKINAVKILRPPGREPKKTWTLRELHRVFLQGNISKFTS
ncbi:hypothetical protein KM043_005195 [Ampulex compressa]|nr:hypothetical protein KM043_005195 [Ampulex compressa]